MGGGGGNFLNDLFHLYIAPEADILAKTGENIAAVGENVGKSFNSAMNPKILQQPDYGIPSYLPYTQLPGGYNPYQMLGGGSGQLTGGGGKGLLGGASRDIGFTPTGGWQGAGNINSIPGGALQLLNMQNSPQVVWGY